MSNQDLDTEYTREEIKEIVIMIRLELYKDDDIEPVPSESTIGHILSRHGFNSLQDRILLKNMYPVNRQNRKSIFLGENHPIFLGNVVQLSIITETRGFYV